MGHFVALNVPPGVVKTKTGQGAVGRWVDALNARFVAGKPQKRAGNLQVNTLIMDGKARGMEAWNGIQGQRLYAVGTNTRLYGSTTGKDVFNITPLRFPQSWTNQLTTLVTKAGVSVHAVAHGFSVGKKFAIYGNSFQGGSLIGGLALNGVWEIVSVSTDDYVLYPSSATGTLGSNPFTTTNTSAVVTVAHTAHGRVTGDGVFYSGATAVGGITIAGEYVITVVNVNSYTITHSAPATSGATGGGGAVVYHYGKGATSGVVLGGSVVPYYTYLTDPFTTTLGSALVTVAHPNHGAKARDTVKVSGSAAVGGITPLGEYQITTVLGVNSYTITHSAAATSGATGGGAGVLLEYEISTGPADKITSALRGFGKGALGSGFFGKSGPAADSAYYDPRTWAIDNVGEDAIMCPLGGTIYYWDSSAAGRADAIPGAPNSLRYAFMTEERFLIALGMNGDPMVMGWPSQDGFTDWIPTAINTANNSRRVRQGSALIAGAPVGGGMNLIWTDTAVYKHQYTGSQFVYDTELDMPESGLIAAQAFANTPKGMMWMSQNRFKMWNGSTTDIPNSPDVETWVFENLDLDQKGKCFAHYDAVNNSVDFYYVPKGGSEPSQYVTVSLDDWSWVNGTETRTTGATFDAGARQPYRVTDGKVFQHEVGLDNNGVSAPSSITLAPYEMSTLFRTRTKLGPQNWAEVYGFDPDFKRQVGDVVINVATYDRVDSDIIDSETETVSIGDSIVDLRSDGRHFTFSLSQDLLGGDWALGSPQLDVQPGGTKR